MSIEKKVKKDDSIKPALKVTDEMRKEWAKSIDKSIKKANERCLKEYGCTLREYYEKYDVAPNPLNDHFKHY